jgi:DNA polymerase
MSDSLALSALDWWTEAGVDTLVDDEPRDWLAHTPPVAPVVEAAASAPSLPIDPAAFRRWLLIDPSVPGAAQTRIDCTGDAADGTVVVVDMPEAADRETGILLSGEAGALFDRMLAAMKLERAAIYLVPFAPARPASGRIGAADGNALAALLRHHLGLIAPRRLLLLGDAPIRALTGLPLAQARGEARTIQINNADVPAIASFHPRFVLERPDYRKAAWADLQLFMAL